MKLVFGFDGPNGAGKSTVMEEVRYKLSRHKILDSTKVITTRFPGGTKLGTAIRSIVLSVDSPPMSPVTEMLLFQADDAETWDSIIKPPVEGDSIFLTDRTWVSSLVYQGSRGTPDEFIKTVALQHQNPGYNIIFVIQIPDGVAKTRIDNRGARDRIESWDDELQEKIRRRWENVKSDHPTLPIIEIDGNAPVTKVADEIVAHILEIHKREKNWIESQSLLPIVPVEIPDF